MKAGRLVWLLAFVALVVTSGSSARVGGLAPGGPRPTGGDAHAGMKIAWSLPDGPVRTHSDIAFWGGIGVAGNYDGFRVFNKETHQLYVSFVCRGPQNDVSLWRYHGRLLLFQSVDRPQIDGATVCSHSAASDTTASDPRAGKASASSTSRTRRARSTCTGCGPTAARTRTRWCRTSRTTGS